jgi:hypothetical protein
MQVTINFFLRVKTRENLKILKNLASNLTISNKYLKCCSVETDSSKEVNKFGYSKGFANDFAIFAFVLLN